jgi:formyltetrahydrofolate deformylase
MENTHILIITCPDQPGLIHAVTGVLARRSLNIVENHEFVDHINGSFHMRTVVEGALSPDDLLRELKLALPASADLSLTAQGTKKKLVLLATREPHCLGDLLLRHAAGEMNADILAVVSQYDSLRELVERFDIPYHHVPVGSLSREEHEYRIAETVAPYRPDYIILAKYMRIFSPTFVGRFGNRMINIHHSFLPAFKGANPYAQAYERGVKIIGATAHFVNNDLDEGPIITQSVIPIDHTQDPASLARAGKDVERTVLARALNLVLENRVVIQGTRTVVFE